MGVSPLGCSVCLMMLVVTCAWWILLGSSDRLVTPAGEAGPGSAGTVRLSRVNEQPTHISCPLGDRTASSPAGRVPTDRRADTSVLRIATFNVEWLFDGIDDSPKHVPWQGAAAADAHLKRVASAVDGLDADILNLVEVEGCFMLHRLVEALPHAQRRAGYAPYVVGSSDSATRQQIGMLSRLRPQVAPQRTQHREPYPMPGSGCGYYDVSTGSKTTGVSKHYWTVFDVPGLGGKELLVVAAHLKARPNDPQSCAQREGQAAVLATAVQEHGAGRHVIVIGDLNDFDPDVADSSGNR